MNTSSFAVFDTCACLVGSFIGNILRYPGQDSIYTYQEKKTAGLGIILNFAAQVPM